MDSALLIWLAVTCDQQHGTVRPVIRIVLRPSNGCLYWAL